jgi:regulator of protease activity HflC (stomatin/prohibitin superfamily)
MSRVLLSSMLALVGCGAVIQPGHRGLLFNSRSGGLQHEVLGPGFHRHGVFGRVDDFDVTYSQNRVDIRTSSAEGLSLELRLAIIYRPVISELYELDTEIGLNYYAEVIEPEFKSAARGVLARHNYTELQAKNDKIEDEIEAEVRRRVGGKHVEISSVTLEQIDYAPEIAAAIRGKLVGEQESVRRKTTLEADALREQLALRHEAEKAQLRAAQEVSAKSHERAIAEQQAAIDRVTAATEAEVKVIYARAAAEETTLMARARAEEQRARSRALTPLAGMERAYEALGKLAGPGTTVLLGDWSKVPSFLFPPGLLRGLGAGASGAAGAPGARQTTAELDPPARGPDAAPPPGPHLQGRRPPR